MHTGAVKEGQNVLLIDDLIATGGTLAAGVKLVEQVTLLSLTGCFCACSEVIICYCDHTQHRLVHTAMVAEQLCVHRAWHAELIR